MSILASVCWKAGSVWLCCGRVCGIPRVVACPRVCLLVRARVWLRCCVVACVPAFVFACVLSRVCPRVCVRAGLACGCVGGPRTQVRGPPPGGVLWRFPTLPHPLGCSTIGAAGLSFQVRNVAGRFPGAVTTTRLCRPSPPFCWPVVWRGVLARRVVGWVGGGLVVVRIVVAALSCPPLLPLFGPCLWARRGWGVSGCPSPPCWPLFGVWGWRSLALPCGGARRLGGGCRVGGVGVVSAH